MFIFLKAITLVCIETDRLYVIVDQKSNKIHTFQLSNCYYFEFYLLYH